MSSRVIERHRLRRWLPAAIAAVMAGAIGAHAAAADIAGTVSEVAGDEVVIRAGQPVRAGDEVQILMRIPGFDEPGLVGSGSVSSVRAGRITATIRERSGTLAVGQIARIRRAGGPAAIPSGAAAIAAPPAAPSAAEPVAPNIPPGLPGAAGPVTFSALEGELNQALQNGSLAGVTASVAGGFVVTLRGTVPSAADKQRALRIARSFREAAQVRDQIFVVEQ